MSFGLAGDIGYLGSASTVPISPPAGFSSLNSPSIEIIDSLSNEFKLYIGRSNLVEFRCRESGNLLDLLSENVDRIQFFVGSTCLDSISNPGAINWLGGNGVVQVKYQSMQLTPGKYPFKLVLFTPLEVYGVVFNDPAKFTANCVKE